jgi:LppP/LprE lipoprotein
MPRRDRLRHPSSPTARRVRRVLGVAGTAVVLGLGVVIATMVLPDDGPEVVAPVPAASPAPAAGQAERRKPRLTARQREQRRRAVDQVRRQGYAPVKLSDYRPGDVLRVLIGRPVGTTPAGRRAFFFAGDEYIGQDALAPSLELRAGRRRKREVTLVYSLYREGDRECCPKGGETRVRFRWTGTALEPRDAIPPDLERLPAAFAQ